MSANNPNQIADLPDFEKSIKDLETIVENMEQGKLALAESLQQFENGVKLVSQCQNALQNAEQTVKLLSNDKLSDFHHDSND